MILLHNIVMDKQKFIKTHVKEFFRMSGIQEGELNLNEVIDYLCSILNAETPNSQNVDYFEKPWLAMKMRGDIPSEYKLEFIRKSKDNFVIAAKERGDYEQ